jgi:hypothetical protein
MVLLGEDAQMDARFAPNITYGQKSFWTHPIDLLCDIGHVESRFNPFGDSGSVSAR